MGKRVNIALTEELHTKAKILSVMKNTSLNQYLEQAIKAAIEEDKELLKKIR